MALRLIEADEAGERFLAVLEASRCNKGEMAHVLGISASGVTRLLRGRRVIEAPPKVIAMKLAGKGFLSEDGEEIWRFLEGAGPPDLPPLRGRDSNPQPTGYRETIRSKSSPHSRHLRLITEVTDYSRTGQSSVEPLRLPA